MTGALLPALVVWLATPAPGAPDHPLDLIPADSLLCWKGCPFPDTEQKPAGPSPLATLIDLGTRIAGSPLKPAQQMTLRIFETLGAVVHYPFAIALIDARARPAGADARGSKVAQLRIAAVVRTDGRSEPFRRIIQKVVNEQTDAGVARLEARTAGRWRYQELRDARLPEWCVIAWGELDEHFVIALGEGVWPLIAAVAEGQVQALSGDEWVSAIRRQRSEEPLIEVIAATQAIRERLDPFVQGRATAFFEAWGDSDTQRAFWELGFVERALFCTASYRRGENTVRRIYANPDFRDERFLKTVPPDSRYAVYRIEVPVFLPRLIRSFYATRGAEERKAAAELWAQIQARLGINAERDALAHLGDHIVLHNYPPHPLRLPLAFTSLIEIRDEPAQVRGTLEALCKAWQEGLEKAAEQTGSPNPTQLQRDRDGIWYIQFGPVASLAWTFTDRFIVTSWSPAALREYLDKAGPRIGRRD